MSFEDVRAQIVLFFTIASVIFLSVNAFVISIRIISNPDQATDIFVKEFPELIKDLVNPWEEIVTLILASVLAAGIVLFRNQ